jgi:hypothetical protein
LTDDVQEKICNAVSAGQTFECAASLVHIDRATLNDWRQRGQQDPNSRYGEFNRALEQALLASETMMVHKILSDPDWKAAKWILKNRFPDRYRERYELSGPAGGAIPLDHTGAKFELTVVCPPPPPDAIPHPAKAAATERNGHPG